MGAYLLHTVRNEYCYVGTQVHYGLVYTFGVPVPLCRSEDKVLGHTGSRFEMKCGGIFVAYSKE